MRRERVSSVLMYLSEIFRIVINLFISVYVIRQLNVEDFGSYKFLNSIIAFAGYFLAWGLEDSLTRYIPEFIAKKKFLKINRIVRVFLSIRISAIIVFAFAFEFNKNWFFPYFNVPPSLLNITLFISLIILFTKTYSLFGISLLSAYVEQHRINAYKIFQNLLKAILFYGAIRLGYGIKGLIFSILICELLAFLYYLYFYFKKYKENQLAVHLNSTSDEGDNKRIRKYATYSGLTNITNVFKETLVDNFVIGRFGNMLSVGYYSYSSTILSLIRSFNPITILKNLYLPILVKKYYSLDSDEGKVELIDVWYQLLTKFYLFIMLPVFLGIAILSKEITTIIFSVKYLAATPVIVILSIAFIIGDLSYTVDFIINISERVKIYLFSEIFSIYNLVMDIILISKYGIIGAAIATGTTIIFRSVYFQIMTRRRIHRTLRFPYSTLFRVVANFVPVIVFLYLVKMYLSTIFALIGVFFISICIYLITSWFSNVFNAGEKALINKIIGKEIWIF